MEYIENCIETKPTPSLPPTHFHLPIKWNSLSNLRTSSHNKPSIFQHTTHSRHLFLRCEVRPKFTWATSMYPIRGGSRSRSFLHPFVVIWCGGKTFRTVMFFVFGKSTLHVVWKSLKLYLANVYQFQIIYNGQVMILFRKQFRWGKFNLLLIP